MEKCFLYKNDGYYCGEGMAYRRLPGNATFTTPPPKPWLKKWPRFVNGVWEMVEDHRERTKEIFGDTAQEATEYWLLDDTWDLPPRKMTRPGPLPDGALLERPEQPEGEKLAQAKDGKLSEINQNYGTVLSACILTTPQKNPTPAELAVSALQFYQEEPDNYEYITNLHSQRKAELESQVKDAETVEEVEAIEAKYAV